MREIKFRAYNRETEKLHEVIVLHNRDLEVIYTDKGCMGNGIQGVDWDNQIDVELLQYTGLKDKNGKDIYEGDILEFNGGNMFRGKFNDIGYVKADVLKMYLKYDIEFIDEAMLDSINWYQGEVIGNVYKNPELLKIIKQKL